MRRKIDLNKVLSLINSYLYYEADVGHFFNKIGRGRAKLGAQAGTLHSDGYRYIILDRVSYPEHYLVWILNTKTVPTYPLQIDHKDQIKDNNKFENLRIVTPGQNNANCLSRKGFYFCKKTKKFRAVVWKDRKQHSCGYFDTEEAALLAVHRKREELYG